MLLLKQNCIVSRIISTKINDYPSWITAIDTQLATNGAELDYSLISYQPPDFWLKQKQKANLLEKYKKE
ncbi:hypothetical protein [Bacillus sp. JJ1562]|uniref:hypothetical protein n=1 Tax=Bacillus sp. JJ1562 TaxID=3122960 RepID=UPI00300151B8